MTDTHECDDGWIRTGENTVKRCLVCHEQRVAAALPIRARDGWNGWVEIPSLKRHIEMLKAWRGAEQGGPWSVTICQKDGPLGTGAGKTRAACGTARLWAQRGYPVAYWETVQFLAAIRATYDGGPDPRSFPNNGLIILDDLLVEAKTDWVDEIINGYISQRYNAAAPTMVITNGSMMLIRERYPRVASRLSEGLVLEWAAPDFRLGRR